LEKLLMNYQHRFLTLSVITAGALSAFIAPGCLIDDCADGICDPANTGGNGGGGGQGGGTATGCIPSEATGAVGDECGVFVSSSLGDDGNAGNKSAPFKSINAALAAANGKAVYLCGETFDENVAVTAGTDVFGALACSDGWSSCGKSRQLPHHRRAEHFDGVPHHRPSRGAWACS
jgi:hypothetical protein